MSQNALLRSVKGLGIPGTTRKEDKKTKLKVAAPALEDDRQSRIRLRVKTLPMFQGLRKDHFAIRKGVRCAGVHLIIDLHGAKRLNDIEHIEATLRRCVEAPTRRCCTSTCTTSSRAASPGSRCSRKATSPSTPGRKRATLRSTFSCAVPPTRIIAFRCCVRPSRPSASASTNCCAARRPDPAVGERELSGRA